ncbi:lipopolysaccharide biosynthesis protein [Thermophilibacter provencensis]|uniref:Oligosaccharide flippase family protein n=1 Tax=Thermophilibacter provencensis TaxID=1852386 RepID=A0ABT7V4Q0_9ACTN|nr:oligosaccharide flippase family protein [Thermophilibacter provencensis]MDM8271578.1 oligosaccharide flippase family protein [Thermophilibacter provencensis]
MNWKEVVGNAAVAFMAQSVAMLLSVVQTLIVPKFLGVTQFGYWQLFVFYASYVKLFSLGLNDGVYLINGGKTWATINRSLISSQFAFGLLYESIIAFGLGLFAFMANLEFGRRLVIFCVAIFLIIQNACLYITGVLQAVNETKKSSMFTIVERIAYLAFLGALFLGGVRNFVPYVLLNLLSNAIGLAYCLCEFKGVLRSGLANVRETARAAISSIRVGIKLTIANLASTLIVGLSRFAIDAAWGIEVFGKVSLSLSLTTFFLAFVNQASMVLFPALRQSGEREIDGFFIFSRDFMGIFFPCMYLLYFPIVAMLSLWLPDYQDSLQFFMYLIPICVYDSKVNISCFTYLKVKRLEARMLTVNLLTTTFSAIGTAIAISVFDSVYGVFISMVSAIVIRSYYLDWFVSKRTGAPKSLVGLSEFLVTAAFILSGLLLSSVCAALVTLAFCCMHLLVCRERAAEMLDLLRRRI